MRVLKDRLQVLLPDLSVYLDVDDLTDGGGAEDLHLCTAMLAFAVEGTRTPLARAVPPLALVFCARR